MNKKYLKNESWNDVTAYAKLCFFLVLQKENLKWREIIPNMKGAVPSLTPLSLL